MASSDSYPVHLGFWTNWEHGKIQGATVTLTRKHGAFLIAFLAIFVGMVGKSFWRLGCFALHRFLSSSDPRDGLHHQRQAILRNSDTAQDGAWRLLMSMIAWRSGRRARNPILRLFPIIVLAFVISAAFGIASIFSSNVTSETTNQVLLKGTRCGTIDSSRPAENAVHKQLTLLLPYQADRAYKFLNYGENCYTNATHTDGCNLYIKPRLPLESKRNAPCPFGDNICKSEDDNLILDSGYLDSLEHLGINTPPKHRFQFRMVHQCAPLKTEGYMQPYNDSQYGPVMRYMYGHNWNVKGGINWTYELAINNTYLPNDNTSSRNIPRLDYSLGMERHYATPNESSFIPTPNVWTPIPALRLDDADVEILFISAPEVHFSAPVNDPWLTATKPASEISDKDTSTKLSAWIQNEPVGVMACANQYQYCNPNLPEGRRCEPLRGMLDPRRSDAVKKVFPEDEQFQTVSWVDDVWIPMLYTITNTVAFIGAPALKARSGMSYGYQGPLPDNQWQLETEHWFKGQYASFQDVFVTTANGLPEALEEFRAPPAANNSVAQNMCRNQKIVSTNFSSFNVLGLSLILILGAWVIILDMGLEPTVAWWQRRQYKKHQLRDEYYSEGKGSHPLYPTLEWSHTSTLQLQRLAHEEAGYGTWSACDGDTPVTKSSELLAAMDLRDVKHPSLKKYPNTAVSEWDDIMPLKPWGVKRSDTGLETLVEEIESDKVGSKMVGDEVEVVMQVVNAREGGRIAMSPVSPVSQESPREQSWRGFR